MTWVRMRIGSRSVTTKAKARDHDDAGGGGGGASFNASERVADPQHDASSPLTLREACADTLANRRFLAGLAVFLVMLAASIALMASGVLEQIATELVALGFAGHVIIFFCFPDRGRPLWVGVRHPDHYLRVCVGLAPGNCDGPWFRRGRATCFGSSLSATCWGTGFTRASASWCRDGGGSSSRWSTR